MNYFKKFLISLKEIIVTYFLSYAIIIISCLIYTLLGNTNLDNFINNHCIYIVIFFYITAIIILTKKYHKKEPPLSTKTIFPLISIGISIAVLMNMIIFKINPPIITKTPLLTTILLFISSSIVGPIYEEIIYRYIFLNKLKT